MVSMKSGLRDRNNMDYLKEIQSTYKPVSMKSGLRDRNNGLSACNRGPEKQSLNEVRS
mgnify:FL=1